MTFYTTFRNIILGLSFVAITASNAYGFKQEPLTLQEECTGEITQGFCVHPGILEKLILFQQCETDPSFKQCLKQSLAEDINPYKHLKLETLKRATEKSNFRPNTITSQGVEKLLNQPKQ